jgi:hypothetical protein
LPTGDARRRRVAVDVSRVRRVVGRASTFNFVLGAGQAIAGRDHGVAGLRVGGERRPAIPRTSETAAATSAM